MQVPSILLGDAADVTAGIFWLKNRDHTTARDSQQLQHVLGKYLAEGPQDGARTLSH